MRRLSPTDVGFLLMERRHQPLHVGALALFRPPPGAPPDFAGRLAARLNQSQTAVPPFDRRPLSRLGVFYWEDDPHFDLAHHFVHMALPKPGRIRELLAMVSRVHSAHLDRAYPLWRVYLIEGLEDGRIATYMKIHHSLVDGVSGIRLLMKSMADSAEESAQMLPTWEVGSGERPKPVLETAMTGLEKLRAGAASVPAVARDLIQTWKDARARNPDVITSLHAPRSILNQKITASRRFAAQSYSMPRIKAVCKALDGTTNDVIMAMCAGALRQYLTDLDALPDKPLIAGVPVSLHRDREHAEPGNAVTFMLATLATDVADPIERFHTIKASMDYNKARFQSMTQAQMLAYAVGMLTPGAVNMIGGWERMPMNVIISNVPGPRAPMYWQGCRLEGLYPVSIVVDGMALNITMVSRGDFVDFGLIACRRTLPSVQRLLDHLEEALVKLEEAVA
ncbi:MAG: WS/DGAT/MGAT family O-acyltransferase [Panacagrimonas sp.]